MLIGYTQTLFSIMESRFRLFVEALGSKVCGVYFNMKYPRPKPISYKGKEYKFHRESVNVGNPYELLFYQITPDIIYMFNDIILNSERILTIPWIPDPMQ